MTVYTVRCKKIITAWPIAGFSRNMVGFAPNEFDYVCLSICSRPHLVLSYINTSSVSIIKHPRTRVIAFTHNTQYIVHQASFFRHSKSDVIVFSIEKNFKEGVEKSYCHMCHCQIGLYYFEMTIEYLEEDTIVTAIFCDNEMVGLDGIELALSVQFFKRKYVAIV